MFGIWTCILMQSCREFCGEHFLFLPQLLKNFATASKVAFKLLGKKKFKKMGEGTVHWRAGANQPAQPAAPRGQHARSPTPRPPLCPLTAPAPSPFSSPLRAPLLALSLALSPPPRAHRNATRHWSSTSLLRLVPSASPPLSAFFHLSKLRIRFSALERDLLAQVSLPRALNFSSESARPRRSSPRCRCP